MQRKAKCVSVPTIQYAASTQNTKNKISALVRVTRIIFFRRRRYRSKLRRRLIFNQQRIRVYQCTCPKSAAIKLSEALYLVLNAAIYNVIEGATKIAVLKILSDSVYLKYL